MFDFGNANIGLVFLLRGCDCICCTYCFPLFNVLWFFDSDGAVLAQPEGKPHDSHHDDCKSDPWRPFPVAQCLRRCREEGSTHHRHEHGRNQGDDVGFMVMCQIDGNHPQREDRQRLVGPTEVLPQHVKAVGILHLPDEQQQ